MLEYSLIKQHKPRFNVRLRDDKSYPFLAVTVSDEWPRAMVRRGTKDKGSRYFGPYAHAYAIRETLDSLLRTFPIRTCSDNKFRTHQRLGRPCLLFHIEKCSGPCVGGHRPRPTTRRLVGELIAFLDGDTQPVIKRLEAEMREAVRRPRVRAGRPAARSADRGPQGHREAADGDRAGRGPRLLRPGRGRAGGRRPGLLRAPGPGGGPQGVHRRQGRGPDPGPAGGPASSSSTTPRRPSGVPPLVLVPEAPEDVETVEAWLAVGPAGAGDGAAGRTGAVDADVEWWAATGRYRVERSVNPDARAGSRVEIRVPQRGDKQGPARDGHPQRRRGVHPAPAASGPPTTTPGPGPSTPCRTPSTCPRRRCASSATT